MKTLVMLGVALVILSGCALRDRNTERPFAPDRLAHLSTVTGSPYTNYEDVWHATLAVMQRNYSVAKIDKDSGRIETHPYLYYSGFRPMKDQTFATIRYDRGMFVPEVKMISFMDLSVEDTFSKRPSKRRWRQILEEGRRAINLERDIQKILGAVRPPTAQPVKPAAVEAPPTPSGPNT